MSNSIDRLLYISSDEKITTAYEARLNEVKDEERRMNSSFSAGRNEGFDEGIKEGELKGIREVARKMKVSGYDSTLITEMTGLTKEEIDNIN